MTQLDAPQPDIFDLLQRLDSTSPYEEIGVVDKVIGLIVESKGPHAKIGDLCYIETRNAYKPTIQAEVVGFKDGHILLMPLEEMLNLSPGCRVFNTGDAFKVAVGPELLGRVLDGLGNPIDDRFEISQDLKFHTTAHAPHPLQRQDIQNPIPLGVKAIDGFITLGLGQRVGVFAGSGVGKSTLLGMIARNTEADMSVIALIGERGREVRDFMENALGHEGLKRAVLVVSTSEQPAMLKIKAAMVATSIAEYFRKSGKNVLLMMDSLTRVAMALREVGLAVGEPPANRGYTPSVYAFMPKLLERSGTSDTGSITGLYTVLVEGDDFNEPVSDMVRGLLDGHIMLSRDLAEQNHFPAIDVSGSISRLMMSITSKEHRQAAGKIRDLMAVYRKSEDLINIGAYVPGSNPKLDRAVALKPEIDNLLLQDVDDKVNFKVTLEIMLQIAKKIG
ncbi:MAG: FliI/YscN family ATPase [Cyanobacteria bacterium]|nr:FliI/YscN family ATPase [Cyanobacteriota bacterium]